jgi:hypothetical protein
MTLTITVMTPRPGSSESFARPRDSSSTSTLPSRPATDRHLAASAVRTTEPGHSLHQRPFGGDGEIDASHPEALIYEPSGNRRRLVGVEFIVDAETWLASHPNTPPLLEGQAFQLVASPNRYSLPPFFELHVWAWRENPNGSFVDWNNRVTCECQ